MVNLLFVLPDNTQMIIIWLCICIIALVLEAATSEVVSIYFSFGALVSMICAITGHVSFYPQLFVFVGVALITLATTRPLFLKYLKTNEVKTNVDALVGKRFTLLKPITENQRGEVKVNDVLWSVITNDNSSIEANCTVEVLSLEGSKLVVKKI
ncbi:MAG: NfeD family protein [bacterium]